MSRPHEQSAHMIGYPHDSDNTDELIAIGLYVFGATAALVAWLVLA